jgi:hypothetical protein
MIKCFFIDVKDISSDVPISSFDKSKIERLAEAILANDGLIRPLILIAAGVERYTVITGDLEYYAAVRAKEKDSRKAEMVNAFVIPPHSQPAAIDQLNLLTGHQPAAIDRLTLLARHQPATAPESKNISISIEQLTAIISQQLQPLQQELIHVNRQLAEQKQILGSISSQRIEPVDLKPQPIDLPVEKPLITNLTTPESIEPVTEPQEAVPELTTAKKPGKQTEPKPPAKAKTTKKDKNESADKVESPIVSTKAVTTKKTPASAKSKPGLDPTIDPTKAASTLNLLNTLSQADLQFRMGKSGLPAGTVKFVSSIIDKRNTQPGNQFASWEIITSEVSGLKAATAKTIINKLK